MSQQSHPILTIDIGGTNFRLALVDGKGQILRHHRDRSYADTGPERSIKRIISAIYDMLSGLDLSAVRGFGVAVAGLVDPVAGILLTSPNLPSWYNTPFKEIFENEFPFPAWVGNDANLAAMGEHMFGAGKGIDDLIYITVSTGIGGGVITGGRLLYGSSGFAGELGHMTIDINGPRCKCGNIGCLEVMASGTAIARLAVENLRKGEESSLKETGGDLNGVTAEAVSAAAAAGDRAAMDVMNTAATNLGVGVVNLVHIFNPELVIIGGGVSKAGDMLFEPVRQVVADRIMPDITVDIVPAALGDDCGLLGAAALVLEESNSN